MRSCRAEAEAGIDETGLREPFRMAYIPATQPPSFPKRGALLASKQDAVFAAIAGLPAELLATIKCEISGISHSNNWPTSEFRTLPMTDIAIVLAHQA